MKDKKKGAKQVENGAKQKGVDDGIWKDPRFAHLVNDPRFKKLPQAERKVKIDKRFQSMFDNDKFKVKYTVDKYGRRADKSSSEDLKKYYDISSTDEDDDEDKQGVGEKKVKSGSEGESDAETPVKDDLGNDILESDEEIANELKELIRDDKIDVARGGLLMTDSSDDEDSSGDEGDELFIEHVWGELDRDAPKTDESTHRLAVCNMDWDRIRANDIMVLCNSFLPSNGSILSVTIYPSEYGKQRLAEEDAAGPPELREIVPQKNADSDDGDDDEGIVHKEDDDEEGNDYHMEKLRQYQLNRLKYYYAVIVCDNVATADKLYEECDGLEYESTATKLDLRFIPDEEEFDDSVIKDSCTSLPDMTKYQPRIFTTKALQQAKVDLTWDETDMDRKELSEKLMSGKLNEVTDAELQKYLAYSSEEDEDADEEKSKANDENDVSSEDEETTKESSIAKYKALLSEIKDKEEEKKRGQVERELTWGIDTQIDTNKIKEVKQKPKDPQLTPFEQIVEKKKAKQKVKKEERKARLKQINQEEDSADPDSDDSDLPDGIDMNDPYFASEFQNGEFAERRSQKKKKSKKSKISDEIDEEEAKQAAALKLLLDDPEDNEKSHFSLKQIQESEGLETQSKRKRKKKLKKSKREIEEEKLSKVDDFEIDTNDKRFSAVYSSHLFNIDPTDPHFKKTKGMETIIDEKLKRRRQQEENGDVVDEEEDESVRKKQKKDVAVSMLVKSIKRKVGGV